jgi:hypothetical protein
MTIRLFSAMFGYDYQLLKQCPAGSKQKVAFLGTLIMIPVFIWMFCTFYMVHSLMGQSMLLSLAAATIMGLMVFFIDRSFITIGAKPSKLLLTTRVAFALIATLLGAISLDLVVFGGDLEEFRAKDRQEKLTAFYQEYEQKHDQEVLRLKAEMDDAKAHYQQLHAAYLTEMDGSGGTGKYGRGRVALAKEQEQMDAKKRWQQLDARYQAELQKLEEEAKSYAQQATRLEQSAILSKIRDLHAFVMSYRITMMAYLLFMLFIFCLEMMFLIYKTLSETTAFEQYLAMQETMAKSKMDQLHADKMRMMQAQTKLGLEQSDKIERLLRRA